MRPAKLPSVEESVSAGGSFEDSGSVPEENYDLAHATHVLIERGLRIALVVSNGTETFRDYRVGNVKDWIPLLGAEDRRISFYCLL